MTSAPSTAFLPPGLLERLGGLELIAKTVVRGFQAGIHRSPLRGAGEDFAKHRDYQQGDDVRYLDWKLYGRTDRLYVREFEERSNLQAFVVVDTSASMEYAGAGGVTKLRYASYVAAALAHLMIGAGDSVGLAAFGAEARLLLAPRARSGHLHDLLLSLERLAPGGSEGAADVLDRVGVTMRRGGRVILISDLLEDDGGEALAAAAGRLRARGDEVMVLRVLTPEESGEAAPDAGLFFDPEHPAREVPATPRLDPGYARRVGAYYAALADRLRQRGVEYVPLSTEQPVEQALVAWVNRRRGA
ncbi:DUF58 domain-containing protein [Longimicrobium sp.]|uniref:DUF58 domain-containing protein n=1 Tax=Longimicrobium sp. TaxID=2029185 RepID=UPI002C7EBA93|nr:DUF58 domain-containing protein [Longimicrobium sp.]HSU14571.1 DUF58 domain-containing protein [Longimicrobium sp.]